MTPSEHTAKTRSTKTGFFATLAARSPVKGTGAPSSTRGGTAFAATVLSLFGLLALASPALAAAPTVTVEPASEVGYLTAHVKGTVDPGGEATTYRFQYITEAQFQENLTNSLPGFENATTGIEVGGLEGTGPQPVEGELTGLAQNTTYHLRLLAENAESAGVPAEAVAASTFTTKEVAKPEVTIENASEVSYLSAKAEGTVELANVDPAFNSSCVFEYVTEAQFEENIANSLSGFEGAAALVCEPGAGTILGSEAQPVAVSANLTGLAPSTTYHLRIVAANAGGSASEEAAATFETLAVAAPAVSIDPITTFTATTAHLTGTVNPEGADPAFNSACRFDYVTQAGFLEGGETFALAASIPCEPETLTGAGSQEVKADLTGLTPHTTYHVRLVAANAGGSGEAVAVETLTTEVQAPLISNTSSVHVTADSADLRAQINPGGAETTYHFEYGTTSSYGQSTPESPSIGADNSLHPAAAAIQGLQPDTTYHYRIVATNSQSPVGGTLGPDRTFTTETTGGEFALPDGRGYELVSPAQKDGAEVLGIGGGGVTIPAGAATEASEDGTSVTYITNAPVGASPPGNIYSTQMFSTRGAGGWSSLDIATPHEQEHGVFESSRGEEYVRFSPDLSHALLTPLGELEPPLAPEIHQEVGSFHEIYLRDNATNTYRAVVTSEPLPKVNFEGATPDLSHVVFGEPSFGGSVDPGGPVGLDPAYPNAEGLFEWADGETRLVSVLPNEKPAGGLTLLGSSRSPAGSLTNVSATRRAISDDGTRVVWSESEEVEHRSMLFTRNMATGETLQVDAVQGGGAAGGGRFKVANSDGSRVFFTDGNALVSGAHQSPKFEVELHEGGDLYMFEPARPEGERLTDLTLGLTGHVNVLEANEAGTSIYIVDSGNTYLLREAPVGSGSWSSTFVTSGLEEGPSQGTERRAEETLQRQAARVSPSGRFLAFMSRRSLTGYDNRDAISGEPDEEVYLYDAEANRLVCASCDPTGARPVGQYDPEAFPGIAIDPANTWGGRWVAAVIPGWTENGALLSTGHQPRYLDDSGRLFFTSSDALVPRDVNGRDDVYEYDPVGVGSCRPPSYGQGASVVFNEEKLGGCVGLISAGTGNTDSLFFDASGKERDGEEGGNVFFTTPDGLVSQDKDATADMYDARVCTQAAPCPSSLAASPACTTTDSCRVAPSPQPGISTGPASSTFAGAGNVKQCPKGKVKKSGKCVARKHKKAHKKHHSAKHKRANSNRGGQK